MFEGIHFKVADEAERAQALRLRQAIYEAELGYDPIDEFDETAPQLIAIDGSTELLAALRILTPDQRPLELERFVDLSEVLPPGCAPGQIGALWIRPDQRRVSSRALLPMALLKLAYAFARKRGITDLVLRTPVPALRRFYGRAFFRPLDHLGFRHPVCGFVHVMHLNLRALEAERSRLQDPVARFLFLTELPNIEV